MAEATPVTEESTINRNSSHQIVLDLQVAEIHLKTNGSSTYGEVNIDRYCTCSRRTSGSQTFFSTSFFF